MARERWSIVLFAAACVLATILLVADVFTVDTCYKRGVAKVLGLLWALVPPVWFLIEWSQFKRGENAHDFEDFKVSQERAKDLWIGVGAALTIVFGHDLLP